MNNNPCQTMPARVTGIVCDLSAVETMRPCVFCGNCDSGAISYLPLALFWTTPAQVSKKRMGDSRLVWNTTPDGHHRLITAVAIGHVKGSLHFPAYFRFIEAVNPYPCGWLNDPQKACGCAPAIVTKYQKRISGPLLDRIDIHIEVPRVDYEKLSGDRMGETSEAIRKRVQAARNIQLTRFANIESSNIVANADMRVGEIRQFCKFQDEGQRLMRSAMTQLNLSARAYHRILKLARTIADLASSEEIHSAHLAEALQYRPRLMMG